MATTPTSPTPGKKKTSAEIAVELDARRARIAGNIEAVKVAVAPARQVHRVISRVQGLFPSDAVNAGSDKLAGVVSSLVGLIGLSRVKKD